MRSKSTESQSRSKVEVIHFDGVTEELIEKSNIINTEAAKSKKSLFYIFKDLSPSILVIITGTIIVFRLNVVSEYSDAILGMIAVTIFSLSLLPPLKRFCLILLQTVPDNIDVEVLKDKIRNEFPCILGIHDLHIWCLTATEIIATCHIVLPQQSTIVYKNFAEKLELYLVRQGITRVTVQPEFHRPEPPADLHNELSPDPSLKSRCMYLCKDGCKDKTCCHESRERDESSQMISLA